MRRRLVNRALGAACAGAFVALGGCSLIAELADQSFQASDAGTSGFPDATMDGGSGAQNDAGPDAKSPLGTARLFVPPPCETSDGGGWQVDCEFGDGGFVFIPNVAAGSQPPVAAVDPDTASHLAVGGVLSDERRSFVAVLAQDLTGADSGTARVLIDPDFGVAEVDTTGAPVGVAAVPGTPEGVFAVLMTNAAADAGSSGDGGAQGVDLVLVFDHDGGAVHHAVFDPAGAALEAFQFEDFDLDAFQGLVLVNRDIGLSRQPAIVRVDLNEPSTPPQFAYVDTREGDAGISYPVTSASLGYQGGFIGTSVPIQQGTLFRFDSTGITTGVPNARIHTDSLALNGGIGTVGSDVGVRGTVAIGTSSGGASAQFFSPPYDASVRDFFFIAAGNAVPNTPPDAVRYVQNFTSDVSYYAVSLTSEPSAQASVLSIARFDIEQGSPLSRPTAPDGGLFSVEFATPMMLGSAFYFLGDICASLLVQNNISPNAASIICFKSNDSPAGSADAGALMDARTGSDD